MCRGRPIKEGGREASKLVKLVGDNSWRSTLVPGQLHLIYKDQDVRTTYCCMLPLRGP
jgi:hypothetical protein